MPTVLLILAGLMGAGGVILSALGAHAAQGLDPAALMLLVHAPAVIAAMAAVHAGLLNRMVGLVGTTDDFWQRAKHGDRPHLEMHIGKPIHFSSVTQKGMERREMRQHNADLVMRHIAGLLPKEYHGVYAGQAIPPA